MGENGSPWRIMFAIQEGHKGGNLTIAGSSE
jgi:hypothetical protein